MSISIDRILSNYGVEAHVTAFGNGHINDTYITDTDPKYILQRINTNVFHDPDAVMDNICLVTEHLRRKISAAGGDPDRETLNIVRTKDGKSYCRDEAGDCFRLTLLVNHATSYEQADPEILYQAAKGFGRFQSYLSDFDATKLKEVIPNFHNTVSRFNDLKVSVAKNASGRLVNAQDEVDFFMEREHYTSVILDAIAEGKIPVRVTHNDTKLNNFMLDDKTKDPVCVIDLDTVMPGSLLYDFGDALRFGASSGDEDEPDTDKIWFDLDKYEAFTKGFCSEIRTMTDKEKELLPFSALLMTFECGGRFLADYIDGDTYFKTDYLEHNLVRARTQIKLVADMEKKMDEMIAITKKYTG